MKHLMATFTTVTLKHMLQSDEIKKSSKGGSSSMHHSEGKCMQSLAGKPEDRQQDRR